MHRLVAMYLGPGTLVFFLDAGSEVYVLVESQADSSLDASEKSWTTENLCSDLVHCWTLMKTALKWNRYFAALCILVSFLPALAQQAPPEIKSPQVNADHTVTFRFFDPGAQKVTVNVEGAKPLEMTKDSHGVWSATTSALDPEIYGYNFVADGVSLVDPNNTQIKTNLLNLSNMVLVPGAPPQP